MTDYPPLFEFLGKVVVISPLLLTLLLGISSLLDHKLTEQKSVSQSGLRVDRFGAAGGDCGHDLDGSPGKSWHPSRS